MIETVDSKSLTEVSFIIKMMPQSMRAKINQKFINLVEEYKDKSYEPHFDLSIPLEKQELREETRAILALIYRDYLCSEEERKAIRDESSEEQFSIEFSRAGAERKPVADEVSVVEYKKENIFKRIYNKIKGIFKTK